jgi:hypothetical protein
MAMGGFLLGLSSGMVSSCRGTAAGGADSVYKEDNIPARLEYVCSAT